MADKKHLIYKEDLLDLFTVQAPSMSYNKMFMAVANAPTVDAVEVVHGRWEKNWHDNNLIGHEYEECSVCGCMISDTEKFWDCNYCPNCGAKMDGDGNA